MKEIRLSSRSVACFCVVLLQITMITSLAPTVSAQGIERDYWPTDEWQVAVPENKGMNSTKLDQMISIAYEEDMSLHSVIVVKDGYIVAEDYLSSTLSINSTHSLYSTTKSITSILFGIAMDQGFMDNVSQRVLDFFPDRTFQNVDSRKGNMTLEHLLTMTTGLDWDEWSTSYGDGTNDYVQLMTSPDPVQLLLDRPMTSDPGSVWTYCSGASHLLSILVNMTSQTNTLEFAREYLFGPIGIERAYWDDDSLDTNFGGHGLSLRPRDMARIGYLMLNNGSWDGEQVISSEWVEESTETRVTRSDIRGYGYQWWTYPDIGAYYSTGLYGQQIIVVPEHDLVVVFTGGFVNEASPYYEFLTEYIIPAAEDDILNNQLSDYLVPIIVIAGAGVVVVLVSVSIFRKR